MKKLALACLTLSALASFNALAQYNPTTSSDTNRRKLDLRFRKGDIPMSKDTLIINSIIGSSQVTGEEASDIIGMDAHYEAMWVTHENYGFAFSPNIDISVQGKKYKVMELSRIRVKGKLLTLFTAQAIGNNGERDDVLSRIYILEEEIIPSLKRAIEEYEQKIEEYKNQLKTITETIHSLNSQKELKSKELKQAKIDQNLKKVEYYVVRSIEEIVLSFDRDIDRQEAQKREIENNIAEVNDRKMEKLENLTELESKLKEIKRTIPEKNRIWGTADIAIGGIGGVYENLQDIKTLKVGGSATLVKGSFHIKGELNETLKLEISATGSLGEIEIAYRKKDGKRMAGYLFDIDGQAYYVKNNKQEKINVVGSFGGSFSVTAGVGIGPVRFLEHFFADGSFTHQDYRVGNTVSLNLMLKRKKASAEIGLGHTVSQECVMGTCVNQGYTGLTVTVRH